MPSLDLLIEFSGGAELLVGNIKEHKVSIPVGAEGCRVEELLIWIKENLLQERPELLLNGPTVRPGILVLINDTDWLLLGELQYKLNSGDRLVFISTLHGG